jgi:hypothetical protein
MVVMREFRIGDKVRFRIGMQLDRLAIKAGTTGLISEIDKRPTRPERTPMIKVRFGKNETSWLAADHVDFAPGGESSKRKPR